MSMSYPPIITNQWLDKKIVIWSVNSLVYGLMGKTAARMKKQIILLINRPCQIA